MTPDELATLSRRLKRAPLWEPSRSTVEVSYARPEIERLLPHRDPFLFVDRITAVDLAQGAIAGRRRIDPSDPLFAGHFPGAPIYPGVLQLETMGQLGICLATFMARGASDVPPDQAPIDVRALHVHWATFQREVGPGDELVLLATAIEHDDFGAICAGQILTQRGASGPDTIASFAVMEVYFVEQA